MAIGLLSLGGAFVSWCWSLTGVGRASWYSGDWEDSDGRSGESGKGALIVLMIVGLAIALYWIYGKVT